MYFSNVLSVQFSLFCNEWTKWKAVASCASWQMLQKDITLLLSSAVPKQPFNSRKRWYVLLTSRVCLDPWHIFAMPRPTQPALGTRTMWCFTLSMWDSHLLDTCCVCLSQGMADCPGLTGCSFQMGWTEIPQMQRERGVQCGAGVQGEHTQLWGTWH